MGKTIEETGPVAHVAEVVHHGEKLVLPQGMDVDAAIDTLIRRRDYLKTPVNFSETFQYFPLDGAFAFAKVLARRFGWVQQVPTPGFWGDEPPRMITIDIDYGKKADVPWGRFQIPGIKGSVECGVFRASDGVFRFILAASVQKADEENIRSIFTDVRIELANNSIYRGKAIRIRFCDDEGECLPLPSPEFLDVNTGDESMLIYSRNLEEAIETNLFTPISRVRDCINNGLTIKRGVLLGGTFGTGKTLAARVAAAKAVEAGITYLYVPRANELTYALAFARQYQSPACVVFCEDIDRVMEGERSVGMDDVLNIIDGIDSKKCNTIVVLTTNEMERINPAMLRPGRLDAVIEVTPPDSEAVERLLRAYGGGLIGNDVNLERAGKALSGNIPAVISEVVKRAKLAEVKRSVFGSKIESLSEESILEAAESMQFQMKLLCGNEPEKQPDVETALSALVEKVVTKALND